MVRVRASQRVPTEQDFGVTHSSANKRASHRAVSAGPAGPARIPCGCASSSRDGPAVPHRQPGNASEAHSLPWTTGCGRRPGRSSSPRPARAAAAGDGSAGVRVRTWSARAGRGACLPRTVGKTLTIAERRPRTGLAVPHRRERGQGEPPGGQEKHNKSPTRARARAEHVLARMKTRKPLRDCRLKGAPTAHPRHRPLRCRSSPCRGPWMADMGRPRTPGTITMVSPHMGP